MDVTLRDNIHWVGYVDWSIRDFHGYVTRRGSTYNAYLIQDEKTALIDTVKAPYTRYLLERIKACCDPAQIDYLICNHAEPDHASAIPEVLKHCPNAVVVCNQKCRDTLERYFDTNGWKWQIVTDGEALSLGQRTLQFINTPMAHWPESMFTYCPEEKILFSMDAFGQHFAGSDRFNDLAPLQTVMHEAKVYYANILMPFSKPVQKALDAASGLDIEMIAPSHGIIWRKNIDMILEAYAAWSVCKAIPKVMIIYDTMWGSTHMMAEAILSGAQDPTLEVDLVAVRASDNTHLITEVLDAAVIAVGTPTLNRVMMPDVASFLKYMEGLKPTGKSAMAFGSYGWMQGGQKDVHQALEAMNFKMLDDPLVCAYRPDESVLTQCRNMGKMMADEALRIAASK